ncbi:dTMP kinase [Streptomyces acidiscabies]|uniref:dTMP kinase n=1 Tax=Streptomyces acidiscabies TaxID=42234 RepID=UPI000951B06D|nr:AAA family ATPase [Streptomyces acidiscabies]
MTPLTGAYDPGAPAAGRRGPLIVLEGVSGCGKSTLTKILAERLSAGSLHTVPDPYMDWAPTMNRTTTALPQFAFYLSGVLHASDVIRRLLPRGPVVSDRYTSSVIAYHSAVHELDMAQVQELIAPFGPYLLHPDRTFYLRVDDAALRERMASKADYNQDDHDMLHVPGRLERLRDNFDAVAAMDPSAIVVDTGALTPEDLADLVISHL